MAAAKSLTEVSQDADHDTLLKAVRKFEFNIRLREMDYVQKM